MVAEHPTTRNRWLARVGYALLALTSFVYFLYLGFPFERVLPRMLAGIEKESGMRVEAASVRAGWLLGLVATDVKLYTAGSRRALGAGEVAEPALRIEKVHVTPKLLKLVTGKLGARIDALTLGGRIRGTVVASKAASQVDLSVEGLEIAKVPLLASMGLNASGQVGGRIELALDPEDGTKTTGKIDLQVKNPRVEESNLVLLKLPATSFERGGAAVIRIKDGRAELADVGLHGDDLDLAVEGEILLKKRLATSQWSARSVVKASEAWKSKVPSLEVFLGPGKQDDGSYRYRIAGILGGLPRTVPERGGHR